MTDGPSSSTDRRLADVDALLGPVAAVAQDPLVLAAREVAATWAADAEAVDQAGVDRPPVDLAARAGLLGAGAPSADG
ncbi:hypothetical protein, partial [Aquipuribacter hungaricus]|uniref:hypothetical protein n=1 Tax=Aquipuribacter hungaricus TaxID=545624 RepID=UPI0030ED4652